MWDSSTRVPAIINAKVPSEKTQEDGFQLSHWSRVRSRGEFSNINFIKRNDRLKCDFFSPHQSNPLKVRHWF